MKLQNNISALGLFAGQVEDATLKGKLLDLGEEFLANIGKMRQIANGCPQHKSYRGHRKPSGGTCNVCQEIYDARQFLGE